MLKRGPTWTPKTEDYSQVFIEQNPWHFSNFKVPEVWAKPTERPLAKFFWNRLKTDDPKRFQLILGPRRVGKSTTMYQTVKRLLNDGISPQRLWWLRLDHPLWMQVELGSIIRAILDLSKASFSTPAYLFLDELTYAKSWDLWLKTFYDEAWPVRIAGSSSATAAIRHRHLESGVGRWEEQYLAPYLFGEYLELLRNPIGIPVKETLTATINACIEANVSITDLAEPRRRFLLTGGFPELLNRTPDATTDEATLLLQSQRTLRTDAVMNAIYKDIPQAFGGVENPMTLERVLYILAGQLTGILSPQNICKGLDGLARPTFDRYLGYLERAFLVFTLPNYSGSESSKQKRGRKLYFVDGAVRNAALQRGLAPLSDQTEMGLLTENLAAGHLHALSQQSQVRVYHWRDGDDEVDLIYDHNESPLAFEIASNVKHSRRGLQAFISRYPRFNKCCYVIAPNAFCINPASSSDGIGTLPLDLFLLAASAQAEQQLEKRLMASPSLSPHATIQPSLFRAEKGTDPTNEGGRS